MKKAIIAIGLGLALVGGQALAAASQPVTSRVGDRLGAELQSSSAWASNSRFNAPPLPVAVIGTIVIIAAIYVTIDDASESN